ncbi:ATP-binding protein [Paratractidigestivibacter sp.]|uniref:ATP-binding protein n=1 Tax=Paratractidigestivibacter sp. TaxID=2847316 RepID=UPI002ABDDFD0|nr:ATP-binding protein [Paratractidigestivibacter sp.]
MNTTELLYASVTCAQILVATALFASSLPLRQRPAQRVATGACAFIAWVLAMSALVPLTMSGNGNLMGTTAIFACSLVATLGMTLFFFRCSIWTALFCTTAGYTMQNLASGSWPLVAEIFPIDLPEPIGTILHLAAPYLVVYIIVYLVLIRKIRRNGLGMVEDKVMLPMMAVVILAVIGFDATIKSLDAYSPSSEVIVVCRLTHTLLCVGVLAFEYEALYKKRVQQEAATLEQIMEDERTQYQVSRDTIEAINVKCHDIKHMIRDLGEASKLPPGVVEEMAAAVKVYDTGVRTGNEALDVLISEKSLACSREGIGLGCIADGAALEFMRPSDLYSLLLNALDNAIEAVRQVKDEGRRSISLVVRRTGDMAVLHVENYFAGEVAFGPDGLPKTSKKDQLNHGFGIKSMCMVAQQYGGTVHVLTQGDVFHLNVAIRVPQGK